MVLGSSVTLEAKSYIPPEIPVDAPRKPAVDEFRAVGVPRYSCVSTKSVPKAAGLGPGAIQLKVMLFHACPVGVATTAPKYPSKLGTKPSVCEAIVPAAALTGNKNVTKPMTRQLTTN